MKASDVLLCLSLEEEQQEEILDRLAKHGHLPGMSYLRLRNMLRRLTMDGLVITREQVNGPRFYRLAEGEAVEVALNRAWAKAEAERNRRKQPKP